MKEQKEEVWVLYRQSPKMAKINSLLPAPTAAPAITKQRYFLSPGIWQG
jgi:hypothetical protein